MSRYPAVGGPAGGYDESLLQRAPQITKADRQEGYSVDILEQGGQANYYPSQFDPNGSRRQQYAGGYAQGRSQQRHQPSPSYPYDQPGPPSMDKADYYSPQTSLEQHPPDIFTVKPYQPPKRWYRTTRGLVILFIVVLVLIGAGVGIAFGIRASTNKVNADKNAQQGAQNGTGGVPPTSADRGSQGENVNTTPPLTVPSLSVTRLDPATQAAAPASSQANLVISLNVDSGAAASPAIQSRPAPTPTPRVTRPTATVPGSGLAPSVDPNCQRFPFLPACRQR
jgi:hypothetical protein